MEQIYEKGKGMPMSRLTEAGACKRSKKFGRHLTSSETGPNYQRAVVMKATIVNAILYNQKYHLWNRSEGIKYKKDLRKFVMEYMSSRYAEVPFMNYQQMKATLGWDHRLVCRYLFGETRPMKVVPKGEVMVGGVPVTVRPDLVYECGDSAELIWFKIGKPNMTQSGKQTAYDREMQLYAGILYGRQLGYKNITASYYFLKKTNDHEEWTDCDQEFFGGGGNIISKQDLYDGKPNAMDQEMQPFISMMTNGIEAEDMAERACEHCQLQSLCKYTMPPKKFEEEKEEE